MLLKKTLSVVLSMAMILSVCTVFCVPFTAGAEEMPTQADYLYNDFGSWSAEQGKGYYNWVGEWSLRDDPYISGGKYLRFNHWNNTQNYNPLLFAFVANPSGSVDPSDSWQIASDSKYLLEIRYRIDGITTSGNALQLMLASSSADSYDISKVTTVLKYVDPAVQDTDNSWVTATYMVETDDIEVPENSNLYLGFRPIWDSNWSGVYNDQYWVDIDYYEIRKVPDFAQHMEIGFDEYVLPAPGEAGSVYTGTNITYTVAEDDAEATGKYLKFTKTIKSNWAPAYALLLNPVGKATKNTLNDCYKMADGKTYRLSFRYKLTYNDSSTEDFVPVALGYTTTDRTVQAAEGVSSDNSQSAIYAKDETTGQDMLLEGNGQWNYFTYDFTMDNITEYSGNGAYLTPYLLLACSNDGRNLWTGKQQNAQYELCIDDITLDSLAEITLVDGSSSKSFYGAPAGIKAGSIYSQSDAELFTLESGAETAEVYKEHGYTDSTGTAYKSYTASVTKAAWFADEALTNPVSETSFTVGGSTYYAGRETVISDENQLAFTGFDEIHPRMANKPQNIWGTFWKDDMGLADIGGWEITDEYAYSGTKSIKSEITANVSDQKNIFYIGSGYEAVLGKSYFVSFYIKGDGKTVKIELSNGISGYNILKPADSVTVVTDEEWQKVNVLYSTVDPEILSYADETWVAPLIRVTSAEDTTVYIDTVTISELNYNQFCQNSAAERIGSDESVVAFRVTSSYVDDENAASISLAGNDYTVSERGFLVSYAADSDYLDLENLSTEKSKYIKNISRKSDFDDCYAYSNGLRTFSARIGGFKADSSESIAVRPYITVENNGLDIALYGEVFVFAVDGKSDTKTVNGSVYNLVWGDEFSGTSLDTLKWREENITKQQDKEHLKIVNGNYSVENGVLSMRSEYDADTQTYTVPYNITSMRSMQYQKGYLEIRAKLPAQWSASSTIWLRTDPWTDSSRINSGEVDIFETFGVKNVLTPNLHVWEKTEYTESTDDYGNTIYNATEIFDHPWNYGTRPKNQYTLDDEEINLFHTIGFLWTDTQMIMYIDGEEYAVYDLTEEAYKYDTSYETTAPSQDSIDEALKNTPMGIIFGAGLFTSENSDYEDDRCADKLNNLIFPMKFEIDYVRLYQNDDCIIKYLK